MADNGLIVFEMPSHIQEQTDYIKHIAETCKYKDKIKFALAINGPNTKESKTENFVAEYRELAVTDPCVSMVEMRGLANEVATKHFDPQYRILSDHNFVFKNDWENFILEAVEDMEKFYQNNNMRCYIGMGGAFGSYPHRRKTFLGPQPVFPCVRGIIYTLGSAYSQMEKLPSSLEEQYLCSILFHSGHVPLRKMMSPIQHTMVNVGGGIHDKALIDKYNSEIVRRIWNDPNWVSKPTYSGKEKLTDGRYYAHCPKNALKAMAELRAKFNPETLILRKIYRPRNFGVNLGE